MYSKLLEERNYGKMPFGVRAHPLVEHTAVNRGVVCRFLYILIRICKEKGTNKHGNRNEIKHVGSLANFMI